MNNIRKRKMKYAKNTLLLLLGFSLFFMSGCLRAVGVKIINNNTLEPSFKFTHFNSEDILRVIIGEIVVYKVDDNGIELEEVWKISSIQSSIDSCPVVTGFKYGSNIDGYATVVGPKQLEWGVKYEAYATVLVKDGEEYATGGTIEFLLKPDRATK